ncbi:MAG: HD-GYP domain-containing protein, partial [Alkalispirochaeta sp.]
RIFYKPMPMNELRDELDALITPVRSGDPEKNTSSVQRFVASLIRLGMSVSPATVHHSRRVSALATRAYTRLMQTRGEAPSGRAALSYAALLHDMGKLFIDQRVLAKQSPLYDEQIDVLEERLTLLERYTSVRTPDDTDTAGMVARIRTGLKAAAGKPDHWALIGASVTELEEKTFTLRSELDLKLIDGDMEEAMFGTTRGSLTDKERAEIERHPVYSQQVAAGIPWGQELQQVPYLCRYHHERLDGSGYPDGLSHPYEFSDELRVLSAADVYDALTDPDRRYRSPLSPGEALRVLKHEVAVGRLDGEAVEMVAWVVNTR